MISFVVRCCTFYERHYAEIVILLYYKVNRSFQRQKIFRHFLHQFLQKETF